jgi:hypothetical protein
MLFESVYDIEVSVRCAGLSLMRLSVRQLALSIIEAQWGEPTCSMRSAHPSGSSSGALLNDRVRKMKSPSRRLRGGGGRGYKL